MGRPPSRVDLFSPPFDAMALAMKAMKAAKAMKAMKTMKKAMKVSKIAKGKRARASVFKGRKAQAWAKACSKARKELNIKGFVPFGGKTAAGKALLAKVRAIYKGA